VADDVGTEPPGRGLVHLDLGGTAALVATSLAAAVAPSAFTAVHATLSVVLFLVGTAALLWAYGLGVARSRADTIDIPGLFLLSGPAAPASIRTPFRVALAVQVVAVVLAASIRPFTEVAFGILAPMYGLGLMALWGGRHGTFPARPLREPS
jgi:hypothetical protein